MTGNIESTRNTESYQEGKTPASALRQAERQLISGPLSSAADSHVLPAVMQKAEFEFLIMTGQTCLHENLTLLQLGRAGQASPAFIIIV